MGSDHKLIQKEEDILKLISAKCHIGVDNVTNSMKPYVFKRNPANGVHIIDVEKTWNKLVLTARIIVAIENPQDVIVVSQRPYGQRAVLKFAQYTGAHCIAGRWTPGTLTNQITKKFMEPRLL